MPNSTTPVKTNWNVFTGAPCAGKTAVINALAQRGYRIVPEVARAYIDSRLALGISLETIKTDRLAFERHILREKKAIESKLHSSELIFLDRAVPDSIAYYQFEGLNPIEAVEESCRVRYRHIFLFERLTFKKDPVRSETVDGAERIEALLIEGYHQLGYRPIRVRVMPVDQRVDFVLQYAI